MSFNIPEHTSIQDILDIHTTARRKQEHFVDAFTWVLSISLALGLFILLQTR